MTVTVPPIQASVESLGLKMTDVKVLLASHAHSDHVAGLARLQKLTGARVFVMRGDDQVIASGGKGQYLYTTDRWDPCNVDRVLNDRDEVNLGGVTLIARLTPGHTRGCTTWTWSALDGGKKYDVVVIGSPNVNPGFQLVNNKDYPEMAADFAKTFEALRACPMTCSSVRMAPLTIHAGTARPPPKKGQANAFVNPEGYKEYVAQKERAFRKNLAAQQAKANRENKIYRHLRSNMSRSRNGRIRSSHSLLHEDLTNELVENVGPCTYRGCGRCRLRGRDWRDEENCLSYSPAAMTLKQRIAAGRSC